MRIYDETKTYKSMTLFGAQANLEVRRGEIITITNCGIAEYKSNVQLKIDKYFSQIKINPDISRTY